MASQEMYVVLIGDMKASRKMEDRAKVQKRLKNALLAINTEFRDTIVANFVVLRGDSFQGIVSSPVNLCDIYYTLFEHINSKFYLGVGIGVISTKISDNIGEMDGKSFHNAIEALENVKKQNLWIEFKAGWETDGIITWLLNFALDAMWNWTKRQKEVVTHYKRMKTEKNKITLREVAKDIGITKQTVSDILKRSRYGMVENAENSFMGYVSQKWLTIECKPKTIDK